MKINVLKFGQHGLEIYLGVIPASHLLHVYKIDRWTVKHRTGYQRKLQESRINNAAKYIKSIEGTFPQSILLNLRKPKKIIFRKKLEQDGMNVGTISFRGMLSVVDGQHRLLAIKRASEDMEEMKNMILPVSILNVPRETEQRLFYVINDRQKGVKTDLVQSLLSEMMHGNLVQAESIFDLEGKRAYQGIAVPVVEALNKKKDNPWKGRILLTNEDKKPWYQVNQRMITIAIAKILQRRMVVEDRKSLQVFIKLFTDYWNVIKSIYPKAFRKPEEYTIQRSAGVYSFSAIFNSVEEICLNRHGKVTKAGIKQALLAVKKNIDKFDSRRKGDLFWHKKDGNDLAKATSLKLINQLIQIMLKGMGR